jgi:hypothetical protein
VRKNFAVRRGDLRPCRSKRLGRPRQCFDGREQLHHPLVAARHQRHHRHPQRCGQHTRLDIDTLPSCHIHHVESEHHR